MMNNKDLSAQELSAPAIQRMFALGQMSRGFVHDFRNILAVISAGLNLAKRHNSDPDLSTTFLTGAPEGVARGMRKIGSASCRERGCRYVYISVVAVS